MPSLLGLTWRKDIVQVGSSCIALQLIIDFIHMELSSNPSHDTRCISGKQGCKQGGSAVYHEEHGHEIPKALTTFL